MNFSLGRCIVLNITKRWQFSILLRQNIHKSKFILLLGQSWKEILLLFLVTHNQTIMTFISLIPSSPPYITPHAFEPLSIGICLGSPFPELLDFPWMNNTPSSEKVEMMLSWSMPYNIKIRLNIREREWAREKEKSK